jgi:hypothetical protein
LTLCWQCAELAWWLTNAFNGEWLRIESAVPKAQADARSIGRWSTQYKVVQAFWEDTVWLALLLSIYQKKEHGAFFSNWNVFTLWWPDFYTSAASSLLDCLGGASTRSAVPRDHHDVELNFWAPRPKLLIMHQRSVTFRPLWT